MTMSEAEGRLKLRFSGEGIDGRPVPINLLASKLQALQNLLFHAAAAVAGDTSARRGLWTNRYREIAELDFVEARHGSLVIELDLPPQRPLLSHEFADREKVVDLVFRFGQAVANPRASIDSERFDIRKDDEDYLLRAFDALVPGPLENYQLELSNSQGHRHHPLIMTGAIKEFIRSRLAKDIPPAVAEPASLVGELIKIHVDVSPEKITIRTKGREIDCFYPNALRDQIANLLAGSMVEVTGEATVDALGQIEKLDRLHSVYTVSMDPLRIRRFEHSGQMFLLKAPLIVEVEYSDGLWVYHIPLINLWGYGERREDALRDLHENFVYLWHEFAEEDDQRLDDLALDVKHVLLEITDRTSDGSVTQCRRMHAM